MRFITLLVMPVLVVSCTSENTGSESGNAENKKIQTIDKKDVAKSDSSITAKQYTTEIFETSGLGWGYKIFDHGTLFINQPHIPAIQGNKGFSSRETAQITANYAISKMEQGFIPPTISPAELDSLGVLD